MSGFRSISSIRFFLIFGGAGRAIAVPDLLAEVRGRPDDVESLKISFFMPYI